MIASFRSKSRKRFWENSERRGLSPHHIIKIDRILEALDLANKPEDLSLPTYGIHKLHGDVPSRWSVWINGNWRITFSFVDNNAVDVDYEDYH